MRKLVIVMTLASLALAACSGGDAPLVTERRTIAIADAEDARVEIEFAGGRLDVTGGAATLAEAEFTFDDARMRPAVEYAELDKTGTMRVLQPDLGGRLRRTRNEWTLRLGSAVPVDLWLRQGFGEQRLGFLGMNVRTVDANLSGGVLLLDLTEVKGPMTGTLEVGSGRAVVRIREDVPVRLTTQTVVGHVYFGDVEAEGDVVETQAFAGAEGADLRLRVGMGDIEVERVPPPAPADPPRRE